MNVAVIGNGIEGQAALRYWQAQGANVTIRDQKDDEDYLEGLDEFDLIVRSPGVHPKLIKTTKPVTSVTREFLAKCPVPVIGVTGTKGKGTTSSLIAKMLEAAGYKVWLGGNIGTPAIDFLEHVQAEDIVVLELSSFQLMDCTQSPQIAVMLMIEGEHLNYHADMNEYTEAKANIFRYQVEGNVAVYNAEDAISARLVDYSKGKHVPYGDPAGAHVKGGQIWFHDTAICSTAEVGLMGAHNLQNVSAAVAAVWDINHDTRLMSAVIKEFKGLPHRLQVVTEVQGIRYVDDSYATNPSATVAALGVFPGPKIAIIGGLDRGLDMKPMAAAIASCNVKQAIVIGQTTAKITAELDRLGYSNYSTGATSMNEIIAQVNSIAENGDTVLLSPGCASFDMFKDFEDRGNQFQAAVKVLP